MHHSALGIPNPATRQTAAEDEGRCVIRTLRLPVATRDSSNEIALGESAEPPLSFGRTPATRQGNRFRQDGRRPPPSEDDNGPSVPAGSESRKKRNSGGTDVSIRVNMARPSSRTDRD